MLALLVESGASFVPTSVCKLAYNALTRYPIDERYYFKVLSETLLIEQDFPHSFINLKVQLKNY